MFNFIKSLYDDEAIGEEIINANIRTYNQAKVVIPDGNQLEWLKATYLGRVKASGMPPINTDHFSDANYICIPFSKLPDPLNARTLGLFILQIERPDIIEKYPKFMEEFWNITTRYKIEPINNLEDVLHE